MTQDYNVNLIVSGGVQDAMAANTAVQGGGEGGAQSLPVLQAQKLATQQIQKEIIARIPPLDRFFKGMGIEVSIKSLLKQSQIFTSTIGALFQMFGAMIDMMLAPFTKYIVLLVEKFAEWIPKMGQVAIWAEKYVFGPIISVITGIHSFLNDPPKAMGNLLTKMGAPDWLVNFLGGGGDTGDGGEGGGGGFLGGALGDAMVAVLGSAAVGAAFSKSIRRGLTNLFMATVDLPGSRIPLVRNLTSWRKGSEMSELGPNISKPPRNVVFDDAGKIIRDSEASLGRRIISKFGEIWPAVRPHLDSLVDGVRTAFSASSNRSIVGIILTGIAAIAIGAYSIFSGGASAIGRSVAPLSRAASRAFNRYGPGGGAGSTVNEGLMTPPDDLPTTRPPSTSWIRRVTNSIRDNIPSVRIGGVRGGLTGLAVAGSLYQGYDQQKRDRQTDVYQNLSRFRHSDPEASWYEQAGGEIQGLAGFNNIGWSQQTQFDLMANTFLGTLVGVLTAPAGFWAGTFGQVGQESAMAKNNRLTGQPWQTGTLLEPLLKFANWANLPGTGGGSTTNVTVNFPNGQQKTHIFSEPTHLEINNEYGGVVIDVTKNNVTESLAATAPPTSPKVDTSNPMIG